MPGDAERAAGGGAWREVARELGDELIVADFLAALDLRDVTPSSTNGPPRGDDRRGPGRGHRRPGARRLRDRGNDPPGLPGKHLVLLTKVPGGVAPEFLLGDLRDFFRFFR